jgi:hypothetical protein
MTYKVLYHQGDEIGLKTKARVGRFSLEDGHLLIRGEQEVSLAVDALRSVELFRMHGTGRMLKIVYEGGCLFVSVIRFSFFGWFALVNFFGTGRLHKELQAAMQQRQDAGPGAAERGR